MHPRAAALLSWQGEEAMLNYFHLIEKTRLWPAHSQWLLYFLLLKDSGKDRPIGLISTMARWWEHLREPEVNQWKLKCAKAWDWSGTGSGAEAAAWEALVAHEADDITCTDPESEMEATVIMDLVKAFERVSLKVVWQWAKYYNFPLSVAAMVLQIFHFPRRVIVQGCTSEEVRTAAAIVAGSKYSVLLLKMVITWPMDRLLHLFPTISLHTYVDDIKARLRDKQRLLVEKVPELVDAMTGLLEKVGMEASLGKEGKSQIMVTSTWLRERLVSPAKTRSIPLRTAMVYLGVDFEVAARGIRTRAGKRLTEVSRRGKRLASLRKSGRTMSGGAAKVYKQGLKAAAMYGVKCLGMADRRLEALRTEAGKAMPGSNGMRSLTLQLALAKADPYFDVTMAPPFEWACAVWDSRLEENTLHRAWKRQLPLVKTWAQVRGPAGATKLSLGRAGWTWPAWDTFRTKNGTLLSLKEVCPQDVSAMLRSGSAIVGGLVQ